MPAPKCPTCHESVYAAEQVLGPVATPYHKRCLKCIKCCKILDAFNILEHGYDPYCKICHPKCFGTKGVGYGNALVAEYTPRISSPSSSKPTTNLPNSFDPDPKSTLTNSENQPSSFINHSHPPSDPYLDHHHHHSSQLDPPYATHMHDGLASSDDTIRVQSVNHLKSDDNPPLQDDRNFPSPSQADPVTPVADSDDLEPPCLASLKIIVKPKPKPTGTATRALPDPGARPSTQVHRSPSTSNPPIIPRSPYLTPLLHRSTIHSSRTPPRVISTLDGPQRCPSCDQTVYHAEQVLAIGKKWHKRCLRCWNCKKVLDSNLSERDGKPYCGRCYDTRFGPAAHGFVMRAGFTSK